MHLHQTSFEAAGDALFRGELDPRILISLWEEWRDIVKRASAVPLSERTKGIEMDAQVEVEIYSGLEPQLRELRETTIGDIGAVISSPSPQDMT